MKGNVCPRCGHNRTSNAVICMRCGLAFDKSQKAPTSGRTSGEKAFLIALPAIICFVGLLIWMLPPPTASQKAARAEDDLRRTACQNAENFIRVLLKAPKTAEFDNCSFSRGEKGKLNILVDVTAQNSFGARLTKTWRLFGDSNGNIVGFDTAALQ